MKHKDPAILLYYDKFISSTNGMRADFRSWYLDLLIYQYDKGGIPNDEDFIAGICRVRPSEYESFKQMLQQVLKQKFVLCEDNTYKNETAEEVLRKREQFLDKRKKSGTIGQVIKIANTIEGYSIYIEQLKSELYNLDIEQVFKYMDKQVLKQKLKLYINEDVNEDKDINIEESITKEVGEEKIHQMQTAIKGLKNVSSLPIQIKFEECEKLLSKYSNHLIWDTLLAMENKADLKKKYKSVYLTLNNWLKNSKENGKITTIQQQSKFTTNERKAGVDNLAELSRKILSGNTGTDNKTGS